MNQKGKVSIPTKIFYGCGAAGQNVVSTILASFLLSYYTDTVLLGAAAVSTMFVLARLLDGITDLTMGGIVDKTHTKLGKARPWIAISAPLLTIGFILLLNVPSGFSDGGKLVYAYLTYIFLNCIAYTIFAISHAGLLARISLDPDDRMTTSAVSTFMNNIAGIVIGTVTVYLVQWFGWSGTSVILGIVMFILIMITFFGVKETVGLDVASGEVKVDEVPFKEGLPIVLKNKYFWMIMLVGVFTLLMNANAVASTIYYCNAVIGDPSYMATLMSIGQIPALVVIAIMPTFSRKFGKRQFMAAGAVLLIVAFFVCGIADGNKTLALAGTILRSIGAGPIFAGIYAFIADVVDYGEWKNGVRTEGLISSAQSIGCKIGIGLGSGVTGWVLALGGYNGAAEVQSASAISAIKFSFGWLGLIFSILLLIVILALDVEKYLPEIRKSLAKKYEDR
jgi:GPH family glycoside/pentoside/hexuronide:cation symporter